MDAAKENEKLKTQLAELQQKLADKKQERSALMKSNNEMKNQEIDARNELVVQLVKMKIGNDAKKQEVRIPFDLKNIREILSVSINFTGRSGDIETQCDTRRTQESQARC